MFTAPTAVGKVAVLVWVCPGLVAWAPRGQQVEQVVTGGEVVLITLCSPRGVVADVGCVIDEGQLLGVSEVTPGVLQVLVVPKLDDLVPPVPPQEQWLTCPPQC